MLLSTSRLVVKGPKGVFTEKGGIVDPYKLCFPHYSCKDILNDFGFVNDFKIEITKDRYMFFSATPMKTAMPTYDDVIDILITKSNIEYNYEDNNHKPIIINDGFIHKNYIGVLFMYRYVPLWLIVTKDATTGEVVYTFVNKNINTPTKGRFIDSVNIYDAIDTMHSSLTQSSHNFLSNFIGYIGRESRHNLTKNDLMGMYSTYKDLKAFNDNIFKYHNSSKETFICDKFYVETYRNLFGDCTKKVYTVIRGNLIIFDGKIDLPDVEDMIKSIGTTKMNEMVEELEKEMAYPVLNEDDGSYRYSIDYLLPNKEWPIDDAYKKGYITFIKPSLYHNDDEAFMRWNSLSNYKNYEHYKYMDKIIKKEDEQIRNLIKSLGKIGSPAAIEKLVRLRTIKTIYKI